MSHLLVAEDDPEILELVKTILETDGHNVLAVTDGREAVAKANENIDLFLLDVAMPGLSGYQAAEAIRKKFPKAKIMFVTSRDYDKYEAAILASGADAFMSKPFGPKDLIQRVRELTK